MTLEISAQGNSVRLEVTAWEGRFPFCPIGVQFHRRQLAEEIVSHAGRYLQKARVMIERVTVSERTATTK